jgi:hypothetical protein
LLVLLLRGDCVLISFVAILNSVYYFYYPRLNKIQRIVLLYLMGLKQYFLGTIFGKKTI